MSPELSDDIGRLALAISESRAIRAQSFFFLDTCMRHPLTDEEVLSELRSLSRFWATYPAYASLENEDEN